MKGDRRGGAPYVRQGRCCRTPTTRHSSKSAASADGGLGRPRPRRSARPRAQSAASSSASSKAGVEEDSRIHELLIDMTEEAAEGRLQTHGGRDSELTQIMEILCCESRSNPC